MMMPANSMLSLFYLAAAAVAVVVSAQDPTTTTNTAPCQSQCSNGGICVLGKAEQAPLNSEFGEGYHCACQPGWTGPTCDEPFDSCGTGNPCRNNGACVLGLRDDYGNEQNYCDCSEAVDEMGNTYVGKWCEHQAVNYCNGGGEGSFCIHGECNPDYDHATGGPGPMCFCSDNFGGQHCEYTKGSVPDCDLDCQNGGHCVLGEMGDDDTNYHYWDTATTLQDGKHCSCREGYDGPLCEHRKSSCGDGHCFNGSRCVEKIGTDGKSHFHCDCSSVESDDKFYAGRFCQYKATTYCTEAPETPLFCVNNGRCKDNVYEGCDCDAPYTGFSCEFVTPMLTSSSSSEMSSSESTTTTTPTTPEQASTSNVDRPPSNGDATEGDASVAASPTAPPATTAPGNTSAEEPTTTTPPALDESVVDDPAYYETCSLSCQNGGVCRKGSKDLGDGMLEDISRDVSHLNQTSDNNHEYCVCQPGWTSLDCSVEVVTCGEGEHLCLHGSKCVSDGEYHACDCSTSDSAAEVVVAGQYCEHKATAICTKGEALGPGKPLSFCTNHGTCNAMVGPEEPHAGCQCPDEWTGPHCENRISTMLEFHPPATATTTASNDDDDTNASDDGTSSNAELAGGEDAMVIVQVLFLMLGLVLFVAIALYCWSVQHQKKLAVAESVGFIAHEEPYRDEPNISPHRDSMTDPFPNKRHSSASFSDKMMTEDAPTRQASRQQQITPSPAHHHHDAESTMEPVDIC